MKVLKHCIIYYEINEDICYLPYMIVFQIFWLVYVIVYLMILLWTSLVLLEFLWLCAGVEIKSRSGRFLMWSARILLQTQDSPPNYEEARYHSLPHSVNPIAWCLLNNMGFGSIVSSQSCLCMFVDLSNIISWSNSSLQFPL